MYYIGSLGPIGVPELLLIGMIIVLLFGAKLIPKLSRGVGESMGELRKGLKEQPAPAEVASNDTAASQRTGRKPRD